MPGLDPGIHVFKCSDKKDVDGQVKPGHDRETITFHVIEYGAMNRDIELNRHCERSEAIQLS